MFNLKKAKLTEITNKIYRTMPLKVKNKDANKMFTKLFSLNLIVKINTKSP